MKGCNLADRSGSQIYHDSIFWQYKKSAGGGGYLRGDRSSILSAPDQMVECLSHHGRYNLAAVGLKHGLSDHKEQEKTLKYWISWVHHSWTQMM